MHLSEEQRKFVEIAQKGKNMDAVTNAITKGAIKKYNKPSDRNIQLNELKIELFNTLRKDD